MVEARQLPPLRNLILAAVFVAALFVVLFLRLPGEGRRDNERTVSGPAFGTTFTVKVVAEGDDAAIKSEVAALVHQIVDAADEAMSTYRRDSEIVAFNEHGSEPFTASAALLEVVSEAQRVSRLTGGAFDITVGPLVDAWGFGPAGMVAEPPPDQELLDLLAVTGYQHIEIDHVDGSLRKRRPECRIDLSAIAKGFSVDGVAAALLEAGYRDFMVEIGGEVTARGTNGSGRTWRIGIERPDAAGRAIQVAVPLANLSLATSGDYRNFIERNGERVSHTIDPRTGRPITHDLASVSVIHSSCMTADALATALEVLGPDEGYEMAEVLELPALFLVRTGDDQFVERPSPVWTALVENAPDSGRVS
jgi:thiamine biosynthesis lipoprotein